MLLWLFFVTWIFDGSFGQNSSEIITDKPRTILFDNGTYCDIMRWNLLVQETGLGFNITVINTTLDTDSDEYLVISADENFDEQNASVLYITGEIKDVKIAIPLTKKAFIEYNPGDGCNANASFELAVQQYEYVVPEPPPTPPNPFPPSNIRTYIEIFVSGKTLDEFKDENFILSFKTFIQEHAFVYSRQIAVENIDLTKPANETVFFGKIQQCPKSWDNHATCVEISLAVFVTKLQTDYELTVPHLEAFWSELVKTEFPDELGIQPYPASDVTTDILWWILWLFIAIIVTVGLGLLFWWLHRRAAEEHALLKEIEENERKQEIFSNVELRKKPNLQPSKHQKIPDFMLNNVDNASVVSAPLPTSNMPVAAPLSPGLAQVQSSSSPLHSPGIAPRPAFFSNVTFNEEDEDT